MEVYNQVEEEVVEDNKEEEYEFPLFGGSVAATKEVASEEFDFPLFATKKDDDTSDRGRLTTRTMKVSLRDETVDTIQQERPISYYFATYTEEDKARFISAAITADEMFKFNEKYPTIDTTHKCLDLELYNHKIEQELQLQKKRKRTRPGKKKRGAIIECRERKDQRKKLLIKLEKERLNKVKKKMFHKRGGKKHKKDKKVDSKASQPPLKKPKYKTET